MRHMSAHDPESSAAEKALALKLGRQKKIQIIDGQQVEVMPGEEDDEDEMETDMEGNVVAVEGSDGQQYVVLEVIQLQDGEEVEQQVAVVGSGDHSVEQAVALMHSDDNAEEILPNIKSSPTRIDPLSTPKKGSSSSIQQDMDNCFGFDDDEDDKEEEETEIPSNSQVHILSGIH